MGSLGATDLVTEEVEYRASMDEQRVWFTSLIPGLRPCLSLSPTNALQRSEPS